MQQLTQELKAGFMTVLEVPFPAINDDNILVKNHYSVISAGTEGKTVTDARKSYLAKAKSRQKEVKQVLSMIKTEGPKKAYDVVMNKLNAPSPLGYSCAGEVIAVGQNIQDIKVGDYVACGGGGAVHAEVVSIPRNLCVKVDRNVDLRHAAFTTIAAIAIQGVRQAEVQFGETCAIIGLGLIGQITVQILRASGINAVGIDIDQKQVDAALENGANLAFNRSQDGLVEIIKEYTRGHGVDSVIITAGTNSLDPVEIAGELCRKKGKVVIVGAVPTGFSRANYFKKELDLRMSSSYGPGRYDDDYELKGKDYPIGYVRFTENRNMQTFVDFLEQQKIDIEKLISHEYPLLEASDAYKMILEKSERFAGILIKYAYTEDKKKDIILDNKIVSSTKVKVGFIGAGNFAQNAILPRIKDKCDFVSIATAEGNMSHYVAKKYSFNKCFDSGDKVVEDKDLNTVFVVTRHNTHAEFVIKALNENKNVFVEKPLAMSFDELSSVKEAYKKSNSQLLLGFNRRFSPFIKKIKSKIIDSQRKSISIRINAGAVPADHWVHDPKVGGGRIIGEACHFIDLAMFIAGSKITSVNAISLKDTNGLNATLSINLQFENGSISSVNYFSNGNSSVPKEKIEVFSEGLVFVIDDFIKMTEYGVKIVKHKLSGQDKGHGQEFTEFLRAIEKGEKMPISFEEIYNSSLATLNVIESIKQNRTINM